ncbi:hypothetical protein J6G99_01130 [bacterium]|nr:hypothetical protein [bacterium]
MKKLVITLIMLITALPSYSAFWNKKSNQTLPSNKPVQEQAQTQSQSETSYPEDVDGEPISEGEYIGQDIDIVQMYRDMPVPEFKYMHDIDPGEYQDTMYSTWSPYPLFRLTAPLYFKSVAIQPGYYLLTPREHKGAWYILFKEAGKVKYIVPCYKKEIVPVDFYKNHLPQVKMTTAQKIREKALKLVGKSVKSSQRKPIPDTYLDATDLDDGFISIIVYYGNYRYYFVLRTIQL